MDASVADVQRSIDFFEGPGSTFDAQFTHASGTVVLVGEDACFMLLTHEKFVGFSKRPLADPRHATGALFTLGVDSREAVDAMVNQAAALGGKPADEPQDHGFMYDRGFYDLDGHRWGGLDGSRGGAGLTGAKSHDASAPGSRHPVVRHAAEAMHGASRRVVDGLHPLRVHPATVHRDGRRGPAERSRRHRPVASPPR